MDPNEIDHRPVTQPVEDVAQRPAQNQAKRCQLPLVLFPADPPSNQQGHRRGEARDQPAGKTAPALDHAHRHPVVPHHGEVDKRHKRLIARLTRKRVIRAALGEGREMAEYGKLGELIEDEDDEGECVGGN